MILKNVVISCSVVEHPVNNNRSCPSEYSLITEDFTAYQFKFDPFVQK